MVSIQIHKVVKVFFVFLLFGYFRDASLNAQNDDIFASPYIESIVIDGDSIITVPIGFMVEELTLNHRNNDIGVRMSTSDSLVYSYFLE